MLFNSTLTHMLTLFLCCSLHQTVLVDLLLAMMDNYNKLGCSTDYAILRPVRHGVIKCNTQAVHDFDRVNADVTSSGFSSSSMC